MDDNTLKHKKPEEKKDKVIEDKRNENGTKEAKKENKIEHFENRITELEDQLKRAVADYKNLERRSIEERAEEIKYANKRLIESLLPAFDTLVLAGKYTQDENIKLTIERVLEILKENGIEKIETFGAKYNADTMEAVEAEEESDVVIEEIRPGFTLNGKLIRPAQVKVGGKQF